MNMTTPRSGQAIDRHSIGLMVPINNTTMEPELRAWLPQVAECHTVKIPRGKGLLTPEVLPEYLEGAFQLAQQFEGHGHEVLAYGCTAASFLAGPAADRQMQARLSDHLGLPVVTTAQSMIAALQRLGVSRVALVTPYSDLVNERLRQYLADEAIEVCAAGSLHAPDVDALGRITAGEVASMARQVMSDRCEAMFIACSQLPTFEILAPLASEFGRPVCSSIQATADEARHCLGPDSGGGSA
jgi:maleate cis-trans isomerase